MNFSDNRITYVIILLVAIGVTLSIFLYLNRKDTLREEPLDVTKWERVDKEIATQGGFALSGDAINYGNGRPYKLHLKRESDGNRTWYAEMIDTGEWYKTNIGKR